MILGSHNSWSYLRPKKWWMRLFRFAAQCQDVDIKTQCEEYGVRCFDLRVRFNHNQLIVAHGRAEYDITEEQLFKDLAYLNDRDCYLRILLECRNKKPTEANIQSFVNLCIYLEDRYPRLRLWCGRSLYDWTVVYPLSYYPTCEEKYASVCSSKLIDDWYPRIYAKLNNKNIIKEGTDLDILLIDFVNYT